ncbi:MAG: bifunctional 1-(5-phosphoribosyl)-5-((5-phosphoribosylamino)methylideneamino)imidazole-4-carboxamide isomerase/phosphoribosylanthranilate isomerase PriA [Microbacteriaceae bacterium]|nr:bifunctional 1-(5-phosphoribosyl)-5-((5-phosphoribosylamino)methylideneamino)imidazole-4-carboxamide isomerase/phosphoribosylanthranilate isomerase PriA [Microbacteriaceae bacterium]
MSSPFQLLPALDISDSLAVRPIHGQLDRNSSKLPPVQVLETFIQAGATWVHVVDLDQALNRGNNQDLIATLISGAPEINFQISGGIRDHATFSRAISSGAKRVNLASQSLTERDWLQEVMSEHGDQISFALDVKGALVAPRGTSDNYGSFEYVVDFLEDLEVKVICLTDVTTDGMLSGPNLELIDRVSSLTSAQLISSGGVANLEHLRQLIDSPNCAGAIVGKAFQTGDLDLTAALDLANGR